MGIFDSNSKTENINTDNRAAGDNGAVVATGKSHIEITNISESEKALEMAASTFSEALDLAEVSNQRADGIAKLALGQAHEQRTSDVKEITEKALPIIVIGFVAWKVWGKK